MACDSPLVVKTDQGNIPVHCGKCPPCRKRRIDAWVFRCQQEDRVSRSSHFLTLTYNPENLPISEKGFPTLRKKDFQLFMKRLRKAVAKDFPNLKITYYACGEYGETYRRPHYHAIIFNCPSPTYYAHAWSHILDQTQERTQKGLIHVGQVTSNSIAYVAAYTSKNSGRSPWPGAEKEFSLYSKGIGESYLVSGYTEQGKPIFTPAYYYHRSRPNDLFLVNPGGGRIAMPRYYRNIIWDEDERAEQIPHIRQGVESELAASRIQLESRGKSWVDEEREAKKSREMLFKKKQNQKLRNYE